MDTTSAPPLPHLIPDSIAHEAPPAAPASETRLRVEPTDQELVARASGGDRAAFGELARRHRRGVFLRALRMLRNEAAAEDVTQQVFARVFVKLSPKMEAFAAYLGTCTRNACADFGRQRRFADVDEHEIATESTPGDEFERHEARAVLRRAVEKLSPKTRAVVSLLIEGSTVGQVAEALGMTEANVSLHLHYAKKHLETPEEPKTRGLTYKGRTQSRAAWAKEFGISTTTLWRRLADGWDLAKALETPAVVGRPRHFDDH